MPARGMSHRPRLTAAAAVAALALLGALVAAPACPAGAAAKYPEPLGYVSDYAGLLSAPERQALEATLRDLEADTSVEVAVVILPAVEGETVKSYAVGLFEAWGVGKRELDNGLLILLALAQREIQVEVGYGLEPILPDGLVGRILDDEMVPFFREDRYAEGLRRGVEAFAARIREAYAGERPILPRAGPTAQLTPVGLAVLACLLALAWWRLAERARRCPRCGARLRAATRVLKAPTALYPGLGERVEACPNCGFTRTRTFRLKPWGGDDLPGPISRGGWAGFGRGFGGFQGRFGGFGGGRSGGGGAGRTF